MRVVLSLVLSVALISSLSKPLLTVSSPILHRWELLPGQFDGFATLGPGELVG